MNFYEAWLVMRDGKRCKIIERPLQIFWLEELKCDKPFYLDKAKMVYLSNEHGWQLKVVHRDVSYMVSDVWCDEAMIDAFMGFNWEIVE
jgi:hypothetical protein